MVKVNSFKLFYFRMKSEKSITSLSRELGVGRRELASLENIKRNRSKFDGYHTKYFPECEFSMLSKIEKALDCHGKLRAGQRDDFMAIYMEYYSSRKGAQNRNIDRLPMLKFQTKIVVFDFDGTITYQRDGMTTWEMIWDYLGYSINECAEYHSQFRKNKISHEEWCDITLEKFISKGFNLSMLHEIAKKVEIIPGFSDVLQELKNRGITIYILSGSIKELIRHSIGENSKYFEQIRANDIRFDRNNIIYQIIGTQYDFSGKADFIKSIIVEHKCSPMDVLYIGNAGNDAWVCQAGARTLCINPTSTDHDNPKQWTYCIKRLRDLREILIHV